jgi:uncharacterized membrane protein
MDDRAPDLIQGLGLVIYPIVKVVGTVTILPLYWMYVIVFELGFGRAARHSETTTTAPLRVGDPFGIAIVGGMVVCLAVVVGAILLVMLIALIRGDRGD